MKLMATCYVTVDGAEASTMRRVVTKIDVTSADAPDVPDDRTRAVGRRYAFRQRALRIWRGCHVEFGPIGAPWSQSRRVYGPVVH
jgi:hypothetical protein